MEKKTTTERVKELTKKLEEGLENLFESEKYKNYLRCMSKFHDYSINNIILILMQKPDASLVAGYTSWQKNFHRNVKRGEKGIQILAPAPYKKKCEQEMKDANGKVMFDKNGQVLTEEVEVMIPMFKPVTVFDVSQTEGEPLPELGTDELKGEVKDYEMMINALKNVSPVPIYTEQIEGGAKGYFSPLEGKIGIMEGMSQVQTVKTMIHEIAHSILHNKEKDATEHKSRETKEVEAESVAYIVCLHFGISANDYSFGYIAGWSSGKEAKELKASLETIQSCARELIDEINKERKREICKEAIAGISGKINEGKKKAQNQTVKKSGKEGTVR